MNHRSLDVTEKKRFKSSQDSHVLTSHHHVMTHDHPRMCSLWLCRVFQNHTCIEQPQFSLARTLHFWTIVLNILWNPCIWHHVQCTTLGLNKTCTSKNVHCRPMWIWIASFLVASIEKMNLLQATSSIIILPVWRSQSRTVSEWVHEQQINPQTTAAKEILFATGVICWRFGQKRWNLVVAVKKSWMTPPTLTCYNGNN